MSPCEMDSEDSEFYGEEDEVDRLNDRVRDFDVDSWIREHGESAGRPLKQKHFTANKSNLHNPYAGVPYAWQLTETVDNFLKRLPPSRTLQTPEVPWIFICNPYIRRVDKAESQANKGNEDEAPGEEGSQTHLSIEGGSEMLGLLSSFIDGMKQWGQPQVVQDREINQQRRQAVLDILRLAHVNKVRAGKWMLFCAPDDVNEVWEIIAKATVNNELGIAAKVAPKSQINDPRRDRLICVYTSDFMDKKDVGRVLQKLRDLRLVKSRDRPIYYKPDIFTYLGIAHGNPWGLRASLYSSTDTFQS